MFRYALGAGLVLISVYPFASATGSANGENSDSRYSVSGRVLNSVTGEPMKRALVTITYAIAESHSEVPPPVTTRDALTDETGVFRFGDLRAGRYMFSAQKPQFVTTSTPGSFVVGPSRDDIELRLEPLAVIEGTVVDEAGQAVAGAEIQAIELTARQGYRQTQRSRTVSTDDRGRYRLWNLTEGKYYLKAAGRSGGTRPYFGENAPRIEWPESFEPTYHGGGHTLDSATPVIVKPGGHAAQADIKLALRSAYRVRGSLAHFTSYEEVQMEVRTLAGESVTCRVAINPSDGRFEVNDLVPGSYVLRATQGHGATEIRGEREITINGSDVTDVMLPLSRGSDIALVFHCGEIRASPCAANVNLVRTDASGSTYFITRTAKNELAFENVMPGEYRLTVDTVDGYASSATWSGAPVEPGGKLVVNGGTSNGVLEIWLQSGGGKVHGVVDTAVPPESRTQVILVPDVPSLAGPTRVRAGKDGRFYADTLAPGDYTVYAVPDTPDLEYANPEALRGLSGRKIRIAPESTQEVTVRGAGI